MRAPALPPTPVFPRPDGVGAASPRDQPPRTDALWRTVFEQAPIPMALIGVTESDFARFLMVNRALERFSGMSRESLLASSFTVVTPPEQVDSDLLAFGAMVGGAPDLGGQPKRYLRADGAPVWGLLSTSIVRGDDGSALYALCQVQDITVQRLAQLDRRALESRHRDTMRSLEEGVISMELDGRLVDVNPAACRLLGRSEPELLTDPHWWRSLEVLGPDDAAVSPSDSPGAEAVRTGRSQRDVRLSVMRGDGRRRAMSANYQPVLDVQTGEPVRLVISFTDVTDRLRHERARGLWSRQVTTAIDESPIGMAVLGLEGSIKRVNPAFCRMLRRDAAELLAISWQAIVHPDELAAVHTRLAALVAGGSQPSTGQRRYLAADGSVVVALVSINLVRDSNGKPTAVFAQLQDITDRTIAEGELARREQQLSAAERVARIGSWEADIRSGKVATSATFYELLALEMPQTGSGTAQFPMRAFMARVHPQDREHTAAMIAANDALDEPTDLEYRIVLPDHTIRHIHHRGEVVLDAAGTRVVRRGTIQDVTAQVAAQSELRAARDSLAAVTDSMAEGLLTTDAEGRIRYINPAGERMLGDGATLVGTVLPGLSGCSGVVRVQDATFTRTDGIGLPVAYTCAPYTAVDGTQGCVVVFSDSTERLAAEARRREELDGLDWVRRIQDALDEERFVLHAQPIIDLDSGDVIQHELLIRMLDRDGNLIAPGAFLPTAERYGQIRDIDRWVIDQAARLAATGRAVELNVSATSIGDPGLLTDIRRSITEHGADPTAMVFEITETAVAGDETAARHFARGLRELGCRLALDDFGTGYGGFIYLKQFPVDYLKIDIEFVRDLVHSAASRHVVSAVVSLASGFDLETVAEGVEDAETLELLQRLGVRHCQGYHLGHPAPIDADARSTPNTPPG